MHTFDYIFLIVVLLVAVIRIWQTFLAKKILPGIRKEGWTFPAAVIVYNSIIVGTIVEYIISTREIDYRVSIAGFLLGNLGLVLTISSMKRLGRFWGLSIEIKKNHRLIKDGVYRYIRHPYYVGVVFEVTGFILFANSYYMFPLAIFLFLILSLRIVIEERVMISVFGQEYEKYKREVGIFFSLAIRNQYE